MIKKIIGRYRGEQHNKHEARIDALESRVSSLERALAELKDRKPEQSTVTSFSEAAEELAKGNEPVLEKDESKLTLRIIEEDCISCGTCADYAPEVFVLDGKIKVISQSGDPEAIEQAMSACPTNCIVLD